MSNALMSGVTGLQAHQTMLDVAGNNLANVNTYGYKTSRVTFSELLSETLRQATQPTGTLGGTNPQQVGYGVAVASIDRDMRQGSLVGTGGSLDMAIEGAGYFVLNDGRSNNIDVYTRVGNFAVDASYYLVDPSTGYRVQRTGNEGVTEGFQDATSDDIRIPYDVALPARATETVTFAGNLSADSTSATTNVLASGLQYTVGGSAAGTDTDLATLDQVSGLAAGETITITGLKPNGTTVSETFTYGSGAGQDGTTFGDLLQKITDAFPDNSGTDPTDPGATASLRNGEIRLTDTAAGYSRTDLYLAYTGAGTLDLPAYFQHLTAGGEEVKNTNIEVFDAQGNGYTLSVAFVRTDEANTWDMVVTNLTGNVVFDDPDDRRVRGITFNTDGSYGGMSATTGDEAAITVRLGGASANSSVLTMDYGLPGEFGGLSSFGGQSTVAASGQDGYEAGYLTSLSVSREGVLVGMFTNGIHRDIAALRLAIFQNPAGLESIGHSYFQASANSGDPVPTRALAGGAGAITGGSLEKSNVDMAQEFVNLIQAQNGYQANARTIRVTNDMLRELASLIR